MRTRSVRAEQRACFCSAGHGASSVSLPLSSQVKDTSCSASNHGRTDCVGPPLPKGRRSREDRGEIEAEREKWEGDSWKSDACSRRRSEINRLQKLVRVLRDFQVKMAPRTFRRRHEETQTQRPANNSQSKTSLMLFFPYLPHQFNVPIPSRPRL